VQRISLAVQNKVMDFLLVLRKLGTWQNPVVHAWYHLVPSNMALDFREFRESDLVFNSESELVFSQPLYSSFPQTLGEGTHVAGLALAAGASASGRERASGKEQAGKTH